MSRYEDGARRRKVALLTQEIERQLAGHTAEQILAHVQTASVLDIKQYAKGAGVRAPSATTWSDVIAWFRGAASVANESVEEIFSRIGSAS